MPNLSRSIPAFVIALATALGAPLAPATATDAAARDATPVAAAPLARIAVVGASATAGFGARVDVGDDSWHHADLGRALAAVVDAEGAAISTHGNIFFFRSPARTGGSLLRRALREEPTVLVAVDFLFWFGYGDRAVDRGPLTDETQRLELLETGLAMLDRVTCPLFVGDFPDMSPAVGRMISPRQMPRAATLAQMNARVRAWAAERPNRTVVPLAKTVERMREGAALPRTDGSPLDIPGRPLLQRDELHPTGDGLLALARIIGDAMIVAVDGAGPDDLVASHDAALERLRISLAPSRPETLILAP